MAISVFSLKANERAKEVALGGNEIRVEKGHAGVRRRSVDGSIIMAPTDVVSASQAFAKTLTDIEQLLAPTEKEVRTIRQDETVDDKLPLQGISYYRVRLPSFQAKVIARVMMSSGPMPCLWASTSCKHPDCRDYDVKGKDSKLIFEHAPGEPGGTEVVHRDLYVGVEAVLGQCAYRLVVEFISAKKIFRATQQGMLARIQELKTDVLKREEFDEHLQVLEERRATRKRQETAMRRNSIPSGAIYVAAMAERSRGATSRYWDIESLREPLVSGDVLLLRAQWLVDFAKTGKALPRRQDLPKEAAFPAVEELLGKVANEPAPPVTQARLVAASWCWLKAEHPDPKGHQLKTLAKALESLLKESGGGDLAVYVDFCSLYQPPRSEQVQEAFERSMNSADIWFCHRLFWKLHLTKLPAGSPAPGFADRGWPYFERCLSSLSADHGMVLDLGRLPEGPATAQQILARCRAERQPPVRPDDFAAALLTKHFYSKTDIELLTKRYGEAFQVLGSAG